MSTNKQAFRQVSGLEFRLVQLALFVNLYWIALKLYRHPLKAGRALKRLIRHGQNVSGAQPLQKGFAIDGKYGWDMFHPLWPSPAFDKFFTHHLEELMPSGKRLGVLRRLLVAITKRCPLQCAHCSEWDTLNQADILDRETLREKIQELVDYGVSQIVYSGGEPLSRFSDLVYLVGHFRDSSQWIYTSGYGLSMEKAKKLKAAGLTGVAVSLDHHLPNGHNHFRGSLKAFEWVRKAIANCQAVGLLVSVNVCPTKEYLAEHGFQSFIDLMLTWQVPIVNVLEPRAVGHFAGQDVAYGPSEKQLMEDFFRRYNFSDQRQIGPIITYPGLSRKKVRCGGGISYLLLDDDGTLRPCPFCKTPIQSPAQQDSPVRESCEA
ncbi:MAG: radical SAM protein [Bacteroidota bacterium]